MKWNATLAHDRMGQPIMIYMQTQCKLLGKEWEDRCSSLMIRTEGLSAEKFAEQMNIVIGLYAGLCMYEEKGPEALLELQQEADEALAPHRPPANTTAHEGAPAAVIDLKNWKSGSEND